MTDIVFKRAHPGELARFDPDTKRCTMNCSPHRDDPRTIKERKFLCEDCDVQPKITRTRIDWQNLTPDAMDKVRTESERQQRVYAINALKRIEAGLAPDPVVFARLALAHILGPDWKENVEL